MIVRWRCPGGQILKGIAGVERRRGSGEEGLAVEFVRPRLGENLDSSMTKFVVFRRKRILIDANLTNGRFRGECAGRETIDVNLAAIRARGRASKRLKLGLQLIGIIRERFQVLAAHDHHVGVVGRSNIDLRRRIRNLHFFLFDLNEQPNIQLLGLSGENLDVFLRENGETLGYSFQGVRPGNESFEFVEAVAVGGGIQRGAACSRQANSGFGDHSARGIRDNTIQCPSGRLRTQIFRDGKNREKKSQTP